MTVPQLAESCAKDVDPPPSERRLIGSGAYSIRLADIDTRLDHLYVLLGEQGERQGYVCARLDGIERVTNESNSALTTLMESIRRHPLLSKFIGSR